jgi:hypothetical protein
MACQSSSSRIENHSSASSGVIRLKSDIPAQIILEYLVDLEPLEEHFDIFFSDTSTYSRPIYLGVVETIL